MAIDATVEQQHLWTVTVAFHWPHGERADLRRGCNQLILIDSGYQFIEELKINILSTIGSM